MSVQHLDIDGYISRCEGAIRKARSNAKLLQGTGARAELLATLRAELRICIDSRRDQLTKVLKEVGADGLKIERIAGHYLATKRVQGDDVAIITSFIELEDVFLTSLELQFPILINPSKSTFTKLACNRAILEGIEGDCIGAKLRLLKAHYLKTVPDAVEHFLFSHFVLIDLLNRAEWRADIPGNVVTLVSQNAIMVRGLYSSKMDPKFRDLWEHQRFKSWLGVTTGERIETLESSMPKINTTPSSRFIVIVTVNEYETQALLDTFVGEGQTPSQETKGGVTYNLLGTHGGNEIIHTVCEMGAGGVGASQQRTHEANEHWHPRAIIAVGIAFGLDETKQQIGDVLVSTQIQDYELGRIGENGSLIPRGDKPSCADILRNRFRQTNTTENRRATDWPRVRFGLVLCGQKLVDNVDYRESLKQLFREAIGGEMEGVGLYVSASSAKVDWIVVKGICDWGHHKNQAEKDVWQKLAAKNAVRVLKAALDVGGLYA